MTSQRHAIMGAVDYSLATLQQLKKDLMFADDSNKAELWAIGSIVASLTAHLIEQCNIVITESAQKGESDLRQDLIEIQYRCHQFIASMIKQ